MPARLLVHLEPAPDRPTVPPSHTGPAVNAAFPGALRDAGESDLSETLHETPPPKPYTLTPLPAEWDRRAGADSRKVQSEVGLPADSLPAPVTQALAATEHLRVARRAYRIAAVTPAAAEPYARLLAEVRPVERWAMRIGTPVAFFTAKGEGARRVRSGRGSVGETVYRLAGPRRAAPDTGHRSDALICFASYAGIGDRTDIGTGHLPPAPVRR
ncbi:hypothetical protein [Thermomonospora amylolytica]|uniref:hypothetical protein n=1 Tax=Thermomonospora amylolytica TaxID=1411117 RepID=UPI000E6C4481|nr:hypothetical protein [Thermomonospora amylolytica]